MCLRLRKGRETPGTPRISINFHGFLMISGGAGPDHGPAPWTLLHRLPRLPALPISPIFKRSSGPRRRPWNWMAPTWAARRSACAGTWRSPWCNDPSPLGELLSAGEAGEALKTAGGAAFSVAQGPEMRCQDGFSRESLQRLKRVIRNSRWARRPRRPCELGPFKQHIQYNVSTI